MYYTTRTYAENSCATTDYSTVLLNVFRVDVTLHHFAFETAETRASMYAAACRGVFQFQSQTVLHRRSPTKARPVCLCLIRRAYVKEVADG